LAAQHADLPFAQDFSFATTVVAADASVDALALLCAQQAAVLLAHSVFPTQQAAVLFAQAALSAVQAVFVSAGTVACAALAVCADANVANPANANSNANFFIVWNDDFVKNYGVMADK
jgi:hypothetical protein